VFKIYGCYWHRYGEQATSEELAQIIRGLDLSNYETKAKLAIYSGPPGGGKGSVWEGFIQRYGDLVERFVLFHTRPMRSGEVMGGPIISGMMLTCSDYRKKGILLQRGFNRQLPGIGGCFISRPV